MNLLELLNDIQIRRIDNKYIQFKAPLANIDEMVDRKELEDILITLSSLSYDLVNDLKWLSK